ncbi:energy transducer TonB [Roseovarius spongiae]|uniref:Energy transducer TonB n=2 Tax=Roseovarius spongiae TaxID=2320272 RepID=A0A3A8ASQ5_9RHOB|nr:energy transducer TonB [Roseovarius spongiae]
MDTGQIVSGVGHAVLILWALFGNVLNSDPIPFEVTQVSAVSEEQFEAAMAGQSAPQAEAEVISPPAPEAPTDTPDLSSAVDAAPEQPAPDTAETPVPDAAPEEVQTAPPADAEVSTDAPVLAPPEEQDMAALVPEESPRPQERPAERVAPEPVAPPEPDTAIDEVEREEVTPDETAETQAPEEEATAPEEAATEIVTEAEETAPSRSVRPKARPNRPAPPEETPVEETQTAEPETPAPAPTDESDIAAALAAAGAGETEEPQETAQETAAPLGNAGRLTAGQEDALRIAVSNCWNVGSLSSDALNTTVVVAMQMTEDAKPVNGSIRLVSSTGGSEGAARQAFEAARRAIIRCGARGFDLPADKFATWQSIEMTFNPEKMRIK